MDKKNPSPKTNLGEAAYAEPSQDAALASSRLWRAAKTLPWHSKRSVGIRTIYQLSTLAVSTVNFSHFLDRSEATPKHFILDQSEISGSKK